MKVGTLNLPRAAKELLKSYGITAEILENESYISFILKYGSLYKNSIALQNIIKNYFVKQDEKMIKEIDMSQRLLNCLLRNNIYYLSDLRYYNREEISKFRNLGNISLTELDKICSTYNIEYYNMPSIPPHWVKKLDFQYLKIIFAKLQVKSIDDFAGMSALNLYNLCKENYDYTTTLYYFLSTEILFSKWSDAFIFEYIEFNELKKLFFTSNIKLMSDLASMGNEEIKKLCNSKFFQISYYVILDAIMKYRIDHKHLMTNRSIQNINYAHPSNGQCYQLKEFEL